MGLVWELLFCFVLELWSLISRKYLNNCEVQKSGNIIIVWHWLSNYTLIGAQYPSTNYSSSICVPPVISLGCSQTGLQGSSGHSGVSYRLCFKKLFNVMYTRLRVLWVENSQLPAAPRQAFIQENITMSSFLQRGWSPSTCHYHHPGTSGGPIKCTCSHDWSYDSFKP